MKSLKTNHMNAMNKWTNAAIQKNSRSTGSYFRDTLNQQLESVENSDGRNKLQQSKKKAPEVRQKEKINVSDKNFKKTESVLNESEQNNVMIDTIREERVSGVSSEKTPSARQDEENVDLSNIAVTEELLPESTVDNEATNIIGVAVWHLQENHNSVKSEQESSEKPEFIKIGTTINSENGRSSEPPNQEELDSQLLSSDLNLLTERPSKKRTDIFTEETSRSAKTDPKAGGKDSQFKTLVVAEFKEIKSEGDASDLSISVSGEEEIKGDSTKFMTDQFGSPEQSSSKPEQKTSSMVEKNVSEFLHRSSSDFKIRTFEQVVEDKLQPMFDSAKLMLEDIRYQLSQTKNQMKVQLKPRELGEMTLDLQLFRGSVVAKIFVENERAKLMIEQNLVQLKESFKDSGTEIKTVEVFVGNGTDFDLNQQNMSQPRQSQGQMRFNKNGQMYHEIILSDEEAKPTWMQTEGFNLLA